MSFNPETFELPLLLPRIKNFELETKEILKKCAEAHKYLGRLSEACKNVPNTGVLIKTLSLREAQTSSEVENIFTTQDRLYQDLVSEEIKDLSSKEVLNYYEAIKKGFTNIHETKMLPLNAIKSLQKMVTENNQGFRNQSHKVVIVNSKKEIVYLPPKDINHMNLLLKELEEYINTEDLHEVDILIKMALIHYQFESIHPFTDGNGRVGRIINILYLVLKDLLYTPVLYLSRYIVDNKSQYYSGLQNIRESYNTEKEEEAWQTFIIYILDGIISTAKDDLNMIQNFSKLMLNTKKLLRDEWKLDFYSQDLVNHLFTQPYTRNSHMQKAMKKSRPTVIRWLSELVNKGYLEVRVIRRDKYYINIKLLELLTKKSNE